MQDDPKKIPFNKDLPTVLFVVRDDGGCGFYRCYQPAVALRRHGLFNTITDLHETTPEHIDQADIVVFQDIGSPSSLEAFAYAVSKNKAIVVESDDLLMNVSPNNPGFQAWSPATLYLHRATEQMHKADALTVTTEALAREYFPYNKNIYILPNYLDQNLWDNPLVRKSDGVIRIGWCGGNSHLDDLKHISKVIEKIVKEFDGKVKFETMGMLKQELPDVFHMHEMAEPCPKCQYQGQYQPQPGEPLQDYPKVLATKAWDIALAPIVDTAFNRAKSDLKIKEYGACGFAVVASAVEPYIQAKKAGADIVLASTFEEWYNAIKWLIENQVERVEMAQRNKEWAEKQYIDDHIEKYAEVYKQIIIKKQNSHGITPGNL